MTAETLSLPPFWRQRLLTVVGGVVNHENLRVLDSWRKAEGGGLAKWNPLNTTLVLPGSSDYNSDHVQNYHRATEGVCATALTLVNGFYPGILADFQAGAKTAEQIVTDRRVQFHTWGTNPDLILTVLKETP